MHRDILPHVIYSPGHLALDLSNGLTEEGIETILYTPGPVDTTASNINADLSLFELELSRRGESGDTYIDLLRKHPFTFVTLARQVQSEIIARAYNDANSGTIDIVHIYSNEEELAMPFSALCNRPVIFSHHDPFNFLVKYKSIMPKYKYLNWVSISYAQRKGMPLDTNWVGNIYHGLSTAAYTPASKPDSDYFAYLGRIIEPKGVHLAINAVNQYNSGSSDPIGLKIAGKHYSDHGKDTYWKKHILPMIDDKISFVGHISESSEKQNFLANAKALLVPSIFEEPFGMVAIEALACGTPVIALNSGALPEIINRKDVGIIAAKEFDNNGSIDEVLTTGNIVDAMKQVDSIDRQLCRSYFEQRFSLETMVNAYHALYERVLKKSQKN